jgi:hypothetical protein
MYIKSQRGRDIIASLNKFRKAGQRLAVVHKFTTSSDRHIKCDICGWPNISKTAAAKGLCTVYVVQNLETGIIFNVGRNCIIDC